MWEYDSDWERTPMVEGLHRHTGEVVLQMFGNFLDDYSSQVSSIQQAMSEITELYFQPIYIKIEPEENTTVVDLIDTDNKVLNKILIVFTSLCLEVRALEKELNNTFLDEIIYYGEGDDEKNILEGEAQLMISRLLPLLQDLVSFVKRCYHVAHQIILQLGAFYDMTKEYSKSLSAADLHMQDMLAHLGQLLLMLITLDELFTNNVTLRDNWNSYVHIVTKAIHDRTRFPEEANKAKMLSKVLRDISKVLFSGNIYQNVLQLTAEKCKPLRMNSGLIEEMEKYIKNALNEVDSKFVTNPEVQNTWSSVCATYVFYVHLFGSSDKKLLKHVWEISKKISSVTLFGNTMWFPDQFICHNLGNLTKKLIDKKTQDAVVSARLNYIQTTTANLPKHLNSYSFQVFSWIIQMEIILKKDLSQFKVDDLKDMCNFYLEGIQTSLKIQKLLINLTNLHGSMARPMTKATVMNLCRLVELLKIVRETYTRHRIVIARSIGHIIQRVSFQILTVVASVKKNLLADKKFCEKHVDKLASLVMVEKCLSGPPTRLRLLVARIAFSVANQRNTFKEEEAMSLSVALTSLCRLPDLLDQLDKATNCHFLYWHRVLLPIYFSALCQSKSHPHRIKYMLEAIEDSGISMSSELQEQVMKPLDNEMMEHLHNKFIKPICEEVETNLRLQAHSHLQSDDVALSDVRIDAKIMLALPAFMFFRRIINLKVNVESYLERTFYDLTTVALHDWRTYGEMRCLADLKYKVATVEDTLPSQTLEQGLDVLEIMRNIHIFVSKYQYNMNNQIFIQYSSNSKHLNTIGIQHIANSIRTHGTGIMNTTVNFTYQFLRKKLVTFSQFLYDEHIKSRLLKDLCFFRDNKAALDTKYPFDRAEKFNRMIRRLGVTPEGLTYLDQFRILITQIGNALGYVRMIRSGGLHCCQNAVRYLPDISNIVNLEELSRNEGLSDICVQTAKALDQVIINMRKDLTSSTSPSEYFKLLVDVFAPVLQDPKNSHLGNFHMIVPPLIVNYCEHIVIAKEKMNKKTKQGAAFTDDGFAIGLAYLISVINLHTELDSLHWFQSIKDKYAFELAKVDQEKKAVAKDDEKLLQTLNLTTRRLRTYQQEYKLLYYGFSSARIFFQRDLLI